MIVDMADQSLHWLCGEVPYCMEHVCGMDSVMIHLIIHRREERNTLQNISYRPLEDTVALRVVVFRLIDVSVGHTSVSFTCVNEALGSTTL